MHWVTLLEEFVEIPKRYSKVWSFDKGRCLVINIAVKSDVVHAYKATTPTSQGFICRTWLAIASIPNGTLPRQVPIYSI